MPGQSSRPVQPPLQMNTPNKGGHVPCEQPFILSHRHGSHITSGQSVSSQNEHSDNHARSGSFGHGKASRPTSAGSQYSALSFAQYGLRQSQGTPVTSSTTSERGDNGVGIERDNSVNGLASFGKLSLERGRTLDVEELDDEGWRIASMEDRIIELSSLGEGAGGAVTKCILKGGKTVFALKV